MEPESGVPVPPPITFDTCGDVEGPFFHGTAAELTPGDLITPGRGSNFDPGRRSNHVYFAAALEAAVWGAELAVALALPDGRGRVYVVEPTGPFEDDPNVTDRRFPGTPTRSVRSREPVVEEVTDWEGHAPEVLDGMLAHIHALRAQGLDIIDD